MSAHGDVQTFRATVEEWERVIPERMTLLVRGAAQTLANEVQSGGRYSPGTPVDTGFARANWDAAVNSMPSAGDAGSPEAAEARVNAAIQQMEIGDQLTLANSAAYIRRLEFGFVGTDAAGRTYNQAGRGFIRLALNAWQQIVDEVGAFLARGHTR